jgi:hypothetical protein
MVIQACNLSTQEATQEEIDFEASLGYIVRLCHKKPRTGQVLVAHVCDPSYLETEIESQED